MSLRVIKGGKDNAAPTGERQTTVNLTKYKDVIAAFKKDFVSRFGREPAGSDINEFLSSLQAIQFGASLLNSKNRPKDEPDPESD